MILKLYLILNLFCFIAKGLSIEWPFRDCAKHEIQTLKVDPCVRMPCNFKVGDSVNITVEFIANQNTNDVKLFGSLRTGGMFSVQVPYIGIDENACNKGYNSNKLDCPLKKGNTYKFILKQTVPYSTRFNVFRYTTWRLVGDNGNDLTCAEFDIYSDYSRKFGEYAIITRDRR